MRVRISHDFITVNEVVLNYILIIDKSHSFMERVITDYLQTLKIPISKNLFRKRVASHPDFPSILAVADTLHQFGIPYTVSRAKKETLGNLPFPIVLHLDTSGGSLLTVYDVKDLEIHREQLNHWSGVMIKAEPVQKITENEHVKALEDEQRFKMVAGLLLATTIGLVATPMAFSFSWIQFIVLVTAIAGAVTGYFLFAKDLGITYQAVESFCNAGTGAGCGKVLRSEEGKLFGFITFSDLTLGYFAAQLIVAGLLVPLWTESGLLAVLGWLSILAVPVIAYSLWLQAVKIKEWCRLCLVVSGILIVQVLFFGSMFYTGVMLPFAIGTVSVVISLLLFGITGSTLLLLKQAIQRKNQAVQNEIVANRIKNSPEVFTSLLFKQRQIDATPFKNDFLIGRPDAPVKLTMVINLYCGPCKNELEQAKELINIYPGIVNLTLRFLKSGDDGQTSALLLKTWLNSLKQQNNGQSRHGSGQVLIDSWYESMDKETFAILHHVNGKLSDKETDSYEQLHYEWVKNAGIKKTPTTFMNGYELPAAYRVKDLFVLIPGLTEFFNNQNEMIKTEVSADAAKILEK